MIMIDDLEIEKCVNCGCVFGVPNGFRTQRRQDKRSFFCPNGHSMSYTESELDTVRRERDRLTQRLAERDDEIKRQRELRETTERRLAATQGVVTKIKKRVGHGVCPCCNRTFGDLTKHMATKHPAWNTETAE